MSHEKYNEKQLLDEELKKAQLAIEHTPRRANAIVLEIVSYHRKCNNRESGVTICGWLINLLNQQKIDWDKDSVKQLLAYLETFLYETTDGSVKILASVLSCIAILIKSESLFADEALELFYPTRTNILQRLQQQADGKVLTEETLGAALQCLDAIAIGISATTERTTDQLKVLEEVGELIIHLHYASRPALKDSSNVSSFFISTLALMAKISVLCPEYTRTRASDLFGLSKTFITHGLDANKPPPLPQKVLPSQHAIFTDEDEEQTEENTRTQFRNNGGKVSKTRKPRVGRNKPIDEVQKLTASIAPSMLFDLKTSDSDASEPENSGQHGNNAQERHRHSKVRLLCINLLGVTASALERRMLYSYWNSLFSGGGVDHLEPPPLLLNVGLRDPAVRCRSAALQVTAQLLYMTKGLLQQAESTDSKRNSMAFLTFSQNLALTILAMFKILATILTTESSLPVLTQALKCLAVLVQATPFQKLEPGIVSCFAPHVRYLVNHRDYAIQVSALMVMEFLVAKRELTPEIASAIGVSMQNAKQSLITNRQQQQQSGEVEANGLLLEDHPEEYCESDGEEPNVTTVTKELEAVQIEGHVLSNDISSSWLLLRVLHNLETDNDLPRFAKTMPSSIRLESLQMIATMATHITLLLPHLEQVGRSLRAALYDQSLDVRIYAARCLDKSAYEIAGFLLSNTNRASMDTEACVVFWQQMLPTIMEHVSSPQELNIALKINLCDALSNIGVVVYERLTRGVQLQLLSFLSNISISNGGSCIGDLNDEDVSVRAAAVRAMAVFALFPSLRQDLVFVEHTAESILRLMSDKNLLVRIKAVWALGNVSDALVGNSGEERLSSELLRRLVQGALQSCNDNDKVRCNAVRALGNLLRLLDDLNDANCRTLFYNAVSKLSDCIRSATGNAKVKWNSCYAIGNILRNEAFFRGSAADKAWQLPLYDALCHAIVHHVNFKVRINAAAAIGNIEQRLYFGAHFESFWSALLAAIEQSARLEHFSEYNHRDKLQEQLCLTICHLIHCAQAEDLPGMRKQLLERVETIHNTWMRVVNRLVPEQADTLLACSVKLQERFKNKDNNQSHLLADQRNAIAFIAQTFSCQ